MTVRVWQRAGGHRHLVAERQPSTAGDYSVSFVPRTARTHRWKATAVWADGRQARSARHPMTGVPVFDPTVQGVTAAQVPYTYRSGCPVGPSYLRVIEMNYWGFDHRVHRGRMVAARWAVPDLSAVFRRAFRARFPIHRMRPVDVYHGSDIRAMAHDDTSAFNCRKVTGDPYRMSRHSWGDAVDINTFENPYVTGTRVYPAGSQGYLRRSPHRRGMIGATGVMASALRAAGWPWGARWSPRTTSTSPRPADDSGHGTSRGAVQGGRRPSLSSP